MTQALAHPTTLAALESAVVVAAVAFVKRQPSIGEAYAELARAVARLDEATKASPAAARPE